MTKKIFVVVMLMTAQLGYSQKLKTKFNWHNLDFEIDSTRGMSTEKAYNELLKGKKSKTVIVGVIDSGIDINHEDLKNIIWTNPKEIDDNGIDDDKNGFIDDINGWDFIGATNGTDINHEQLESVRIYKSLSEKFGENPKRKTIRKNKNDYQLFQNLKKEIETEKQEAEKNLPFYEKLKDNFSIVELILQNTTGKKELTKTDVVGIKDEEVDRNIRQAKQYWLNLDAMGANKTDIEEGINHFKEQLEYNFNLDFNPRSIIADNPTKLEYGTYGNNEVTGPDAMHGTHVAGIIGANRSNDKGVKGVADNVKIMIIRAVPNGDERDKDVANAIKYAVDNGAEIINMSFGKAYSPLKNWVDDACKYAQSKGVLLVTAAGNDNTNVDQKPQYPSKLLKDGSKINSWINVGAQSHEDGIKCVADFSNFGKQDVDVFAPGTAIYSTVPNSRYEEKQGTSMAAPAVAGVAALLKSYFPNFTAAQIKDIIINSSIKTPDMDVQSPETKNIVKFSSLCNSAGWVNTYSAVKMAIELSKK